MSVNAKHEVRSRSVSESLLADLHGCRSCSPFSIVVHIALSLLSDSEIDVPQNEKSGENPYQRSNFAEFASRDFDHCI
jgi:hypothetical protein